MEPTTVMSVVGFMQRLGILAHCSQHVNLSSPNENAVQSPSPGLLQERWLDPMAPYCPVDADSAQREPSLPAASPASSPGVRGRAGAHNSIQPNTSPPASPEAQQPVGTPKASPPVSPGGGAPKRFLAFSTGPRQVQDMWHGICWQLCSGDIGACSCAVCVAQSAHRCTVSVLQQKDEFCCYAANSRCTVIAMIH